MDVIKEKWFQSGTRSLLSKKVQNTYIVGSAWGYCDQTKPTTLSTLLFLKSYIELTVKCATLWKKAAVVRQGEFVSSPCGLFT